MGEPGTRSIELAPADALPAELPFAKALERVLRSGRPLALVAGAPPRAVLESELRFSWQAQVDPDRPVGELARADLVVGSPCDAESRLAEDASLAAIAVVSSGAATLCLREVAPIRRAIVMAGGFGTRLRPLTDGTPKPLLDVGGRPLLFRILELLRKHGVARVHVSVHYLGEQVRSALGDGSAFGVAIDYLEEELPLGTGAGLSLLGACDEPFFVVNGDILTDVDLTAMARQHALAHNLATVATYLFPAPLPYGLMHADRDRIERIEEKPVFRYLVNAGIYAFAKDVLARVEHGAPLAMVDFLNAEAASGARIGRFALCEYWNDVGSHADYERARQDVATL